jgi:putative tricarboxylic transport membrane protein
MGSAGLRLGNLAVGLGVVALGLVAAWQTTLIPSSTYAQVGPRVFAWAASGLLVGMGGLLLLEALRGGWTGDEEYGDLDITGGMWMIAALVANVFLIDLDLPGLGTVGFTIASTVLFTLTARAFGSRLPARDAAIGFALAFVAYIGFDRVLGYRIGTGIIERLF